MSFTAWFFLLALIISLLVFNFVYEFKGLKRALLNSAAVFITLLLVLVGIMSLIAFTS